MNNADWLHTLVKNLYSLQQANQLTDVVMYDLYHNKVTLHAVVLACCSTWWQSAFLEVSILPDFPEHAKIGEIQYLCYEGMFVYIWHIQEI